MRSLAFLRPAPVFLAAALALIVTAALGARPDDEPATPSKETGTAGAERDRSPVALAISKDGSRLLTANQTSGTVSLVDPKAGKVLAELATGDRPAGVAFAPDGKTGVVTHWFGYDLAVLGVGPASLKVIGRVEVGPEPRGVAIAPDGKTAYVAVGVSNEVVRVDLATNGVTGRLEVGREPRGIAITPDGRRLLVSNARSQTVSLISTTTFEQERAIWVDGDNLRQVTWSADGKTGYLANMKNRGFATTRNNIDLGWVLGQRLTKILPEEPDDPFATLSLDPQGRAAGDAYGVAAGEDGKFLAISCGGTHEVMIFRTDLRRLPWRPGGSRDLIAPELLKNDGRFRRIVTGGRPTELAFGPDGKTLYVANYFENAVQVIDAEAGKITETIALGGPKEVSLARQGEMLFHDAGRSFNQWYSCNTCHPDGHTNGLDFDTLNDGRQDLSPGHHRSRKKVLTLRRVAQTAPWTWHGWQKDLDDAMVESFTKSMQGKRPEESDVKALVAFLGTLDFPRNPYRNADGSLTEEAKRGAEVYRSAKAACNTCHGGPELSDGKIHSVGLEEPDDAYRGYNPPSLRGTYDKDPYLHDGRAKTLRNALTGAHNPDLVTGQGELNDKELDDLIAYLKSL